MYLGRVQIRYSACNYFEDGTRILVHQTLTSSVVQVYLSDTVQARRSSQFQFIRIDADGVIWRGYQASSGRKSAGAIECEGKSRATDEVLSRVTGARLPR